MTTKAKRKEPKAVERATPSQPQSQQPRFVSPTSALYSMVLNWCGLTEIDPPQYRADSRQRDAWLSQVWRLEPHLAGVINAVTLIDSNRGWSMTGGSRQVNRFSEMLHYAEGGDGWRIFCRKASLSYWCTDLGAVTEVGRVGNAGPARALWNVDSTLCRLTGRPDTPLEYRPRQGGLQAWGPSDFFRVCSMPTAHEGLHGLGFCAISRAVEVLRILYAVLVHDQEQIAVRAPRGLLLLKGITQAQWDESLQAREEQLDGMERRYYGGVQVLASGMDDIEAKLVGLSQLPQSFDARQFYDLCLYTIALVVGYDPSEFWPVQFGALGRGTETEVMHQKATGKGGLDFAYSFQEQLQAELPDTLGFEFEQRDDAGELARVAVEKAKWDKVIAAYSTGPVGAEGIVSREEARVLAAEEGLIPEEWTEAEEEVEATDTESAPEESEESPSEEEPAEETPIEQQRARERVMDSYPVRRAMERWPHEDIVAYTWPQNRMGVLYVPHRPTLWPVERALYSGGSVKITDADVRQAIREARERVGEEFAALLEAPVATPEQLEAWHG